MKSRRKPETVSHGISSSAVYGVTSILATFLLLPLIISTVGAASYGVWLLLSVLSTYLYQADLGLGTAIVHFLSRHRDDVDPTTRREIMSASLAWMLAASLLALALYVAIGTLILDAHAADADLTSSERTALLCLGSALVALIAARAFPAALQGMGYWVFQRSTQTAGVFLRVAGTLVACLWLDSIVAVAAAEVLALVAPVLASTWKAQRIGIAYVRPRYVRRHMLGTLFAYSRLSFAVGAAVAILFQADTFIVGIVAGAAAVTYYNAAFRALSSVNQLMSWVADPLLPAMTRLFTQKRDEALALLSGMMFVSLWLATLTCVGLSIASNDLVSVWLGNDVPVREISVTMIVLLGVPLVRATNFAATAGAYAVGRPGAFLPMYAAWCVGNVALSLFLGSIFGIIGVALGTLIPLVLVQPWFQTRAEAVLGLSITAWWRECIVPVMQLALAGAALASATALTAIAFGLPSPGLAAAAAFAAGYVTATFVRRSRLPLAPVLAAARARM